MRSAATFAFASLLVLATPALAQKDAPDAAKQHADKVAEQVAANWASAPIEEVTQSSKGTARVDGKAIPYTQTAGTLTINKQGLTISGMTASNKPYDGTNTATIDNTNDALVTVVAGDHVTLNTSASATFSQANAGNNLTVTGSGFTISGAEANDYSLSQPTALANITALAISITATNQSKTYGFGGTSAVMLASAVGWLKL